MKLVINTIINKLSYPILKTILKLGPNRTSGPTWAIKTLQRKTPLTWFFGVGTSAKYCVTLSYTSQCTLSLLFSFSFPVWIFSTAKVMRHLLSFFLSSENEDVWCVYYYETLWRFSLTFFLLFGFAFLSKVLTVSG